LEANQQVIKRQIKDNIENREEYEGLIETPYWNLMLDKRVLRIKERFVGHRSSLPQKVVQHEIWTRGLKKRHNYRRQSPWRKMQLTIHLNEWV
jgi:hypothetical protein